MKSHILVLNFNGKPLLEACLPSIVSAAAEAVGCDVSVVDNGSADGSVEWLRSHWPDVGLYQRPNLGLVSFNRVVAELDAPVVLLLNNDVKLASGSVSGLLRAFQEHGDCFLAAPLCWGFDGKSYEGMLTRVRFRRGLVQASTRFPGYEQYIHRSGWTACAGPVLAVDREKFLALGGYDPLYLPGRIEDLDLCYRGWLAGWKAYYVPEAVAYHQGFGSFHAAFGAVGCDRLALRNTLLFVWKNVRGLRHVGAHLAMLPLRILHSLASAAWDDPARRLLFCRAFLSALPRLPAALRRRWSATIQENAILEQARRNWLSRRRLLRAGEREYFTRFAWTTAPERALGAARERRSG